MVCFCPQSRLKSRAASARTIKKTLFNPNGVFFEKFCNKRDKRPFPIVMIIERKFIVQIGGAEKKKT